ncbi:hypothetical protein HJFPF1_05117 [Paramyrothecium foliicola]|nr:hypothetical protein HJFPF1_05117 [Paramyrothecium foliicola]
MATFINLCVEGIVYFSSRRSVEDELMLEQFSKSTFDVLYAKVASEWRQQGDIVIPFQDTRRTLVSTVWVFDLDNDILRFHKEHHSLQTRLDLVRQRAVKIDDFEPSPLPAIPSRALRSVVRCRHITLRHTIVGTKRHNVFINRVLADFAHQWRHLLCGRYNDYTFRKLACAIIRIVTLDFRIIEITTRRRDEGGHLVGSRDLPSWQPFDDNIVRTGGASIVICRHARHAISLIRQDSVQRRQLYSSDLGVYTYLILSIHEIMLYRIDSESERCTLSESLFDSSFCPSPAAVKQLIEATHRMHLDTLFGKLPLEVQSMVLDHVSSGPVEKARVGCLLSAGLLFA